MKWVLCCFLAVSAISGARTVHEAPPQNDYDYYGDSSESYSEAAPEGALLFKRLSPGSYRLGSYSQGSQGDYSQGAYGQGDYSQESYGQGGYSQETYGQGDYTQESYGQKGYSQENYGKGYIQGSYGPGDYGQGVYGQRSYDQEGYGKESYDQRALNGSKKDGPENSKNSGPDYSKIGSSNDSKKSGPNDSKKGGQDDSKDVGRNDYKKSSLNESKKGSGPINSMKSGLDDSKKGRPDDSKRGGSDASKKGLDGSKKSGSDGSKKRSSVDFTDGDQLQSLSVSGASSLIEFLSTLVNSLLEILTGNSDLTPGNILSSIQTMDFKQIFSSMQQYIPDFTNFQQYFDVQNIIQDLLNPDAIQKISEYISDIIDRVNNGESIQEIINQIFYSLLGV